MKPPKDTPIRILTNQRRKVAQVLKNHDHPITATELCAEIDDPPMSDLLEHLRVLCATGIVIEPVPRRFEISDSGAKLLQLQAAIKAATPEPHL